MSISSDENNKEADIELQSRDTMGNKQENGSAHKQTDTPQTPIEGNQSKSTLRNKWASVRNVITATSIVKKPVNKKKGSVTRQDSFLKRFSTRQHYRTDSEESLDTDDESLDVVYIHNDATVFKPDGSPMFYWLLIVTIAVLYNLWTCIVRQAFRELQVDYKYAWITLDIISDVIYVLDIVAQLRTGYLEQGLMVLDAVKLARRYVHSLYFKIDIICLLPLDFLQFAIDWQPLLRFPRFLKVYRALRFLYMLETRTAYPNFVRVANLTHMLFLGCHWFAAFYFMISEAEGFHSEWSYPKPSGSFNSLTRKYLASLFWSTLTLTTIGDLPPPETNWEYVFVIGSYLIGVFIFATIVGQVGNVITNRNASRLEFERLLDGAKLYMRMHNVPAPVQRRVQRWYDYVWTRGRMSGSDINSLGLLPDKLKTELAIHVNLETLRKVTIFNECQPEFLHDLVLKMRAYIFTPGDLICRRGEVAREMFIIADGVVEIISESGSILTQMSTGNFFGEIGILNLDGGINRRTADVKSVGYSELFVLSREDVLAALKDHPDAQEIIRKYAEQRLKQVLKERQKLQASRSSIPHNESTLSKLLIVPRKSLFSSGRRKSTGSLSWRTKKHQNSRYFDKILQLSRKGKSKHRVGSTSGIEPQVSNSDNENSTSRGDSDIADVDSCHKIIDNCNSDSTQCVDLCNSERVGANDGITRLTDIKIQVKDDLDVPISSQYSDQSESSLDNSRDQNDVTLLKDSGPEDIQKLPEIDDGASSKQCCKCGHLEEKLLLIEKQLICVEKLYHEGIKQLETFNEINEKYVQMLNTIPDDLDDESDVVLHVPVITESTKF